MSQSFKVGDLVTSSSEHFASVLPTDVFKIEKAPRTAREKNYVAKPVDPATGNPIPGARGLRGPVFCFTAYDPENPPTNEPGEYLPTPPSGSLLRVTGAPGIPDGLYAAIGYGVRPNTVKAAVLGGDDFRYWKAIGLKYVEVIDPARVTIADAE